MGLRARQILHRPIAANHHVGTTKKRGITRGFFKRGGEINTDTISFEVDADQGVVRVLEKGEESRSPQKDLIDEYLDLLIGKKLYPALNGYSAFMLGAGLNFEKYVKEWYGNHFSCDVFILMKEGFSQVWFSEEWFTLASQIGLEEYIKDYKKFQKRIDYFQGRVAIINNFYSEYSYSKINRLEEKRLLEVVSEIRDLTWDTNAPTICVNNVDKNVSWDTLQACTPNLSRNEFDKIWEKASNPAFESIDKVQLTEFLNLTISNKPWGEIVEECQYFLTNYYSAKELLLVGKYLEEQYGDFVNNPEKSHRKIKSEFLEIEKNIKSHQEWLGTLSKDEKLLAEYLHKVMLLRDRRKSFLNRGLTILYRIAEELFSRANIDKSLIPYYTMDELMLGTGYLKDIKAKLEDRKTGFELLIRPSGEIKKLNISIEKATEKVNHFFNGPDDKKFEEGIIRGQIGSKGIVRGRVRIVFDVYSDHGFKGKEILVTGMTRPEFVPLMKKASGIVTDEGGITCHAAIVSRELGLPCVIGTGNATKVLHDGDLVEVDADNGVVRVLEKGASQTKKEGDTISFDGKEWFLYITRNVSLWADCLVAKGNFLHFPAFGINARFPLLTVVFDSTETHYLTYEPAYTKAKNTVLDSVLGPGRPKELKLVYETLGKEFLAALKKCQTHTTVKNWEEFTYQYARYSAGLNLTAILGRIGAEALEARLRSLGVPEEKTAETISCITYPKEHTPLFLSQRDLYLLAAKAQAGEITEAAVTAELERWLEKNHHIPVNFTSEPWTIEDARQQFAAISAKDATRELKRLDADHHDRAVRAEKKLKEFNDPQLTELATAIAFATYLNEYRKNIFSQVSLGFRPIFQKIAALGGSQSWKDCFYLTPEEMTELLKGNQVDIEKLKKQRQVAVVYINESGEVKVLGSEESRRLAKHVRTSVDYTASADQVTSLRGYSANRGVVRGTVKIVSDRKDFHKVKAGDILVAVATSVDFVPVMEKAAAFVTNEGGITSHASIVSREMGKPCIIGTKNATQVLKDGDLVEVDADTGVVRILEPNGCTSFKRW